jgi:hypothetical protein
MYNLTDLSRAIVDMIAFKDYWQDFPKLCTLTERYFPAFWDGDTSWIALDLESSEGRVVLIRLSVKRASLQDGHYEPQVREKEPPREAYSSFGDFVADAIRANENNEQLACFRSDNEPIFQPTLIHPELPRQAIAEISRVNKKVIPATENALVLRTDFSDESAWKSLRGMLQNRDDEFGPSLDFVSDKAYEGITADQLPSFLPKDLQIPFACLVDRNAIKHPDHPILVIDLHDRPGRTFRVTPSALGDVANNLSIANMDFGEFVEAVDQEGIFRGFN